MSLLRCFLELGHYMFKLKEFSISSSMKSIKMIVYFGKQGLGCLTFAWTPQQPWALSSCCPHLSAAEKLELEGETLEEPVGQLQLSACSCRPDKAAAGHPGLVAAHTGQGQYHWTHDSKQGYMQWTLAYRVKRCIVQHVNYGYDENTYRIMQLIIMYFFQRCLLVI